MVVDGAVQVVVNGKIRWVYGGATKAFPDRVCRDRVGLAGQQRRGKNCGVEQVVVDGAVKVVVNGKIRWVYGGQRWLFQRAF